MHGIFHLNGSIKHYDWGGFSFLPNLLGSTNVSHQPFAEYWLGVNPADPSKVIHDNQTMFLADFISENKQEVLGKAAKHFDTLPFLLKILDVRDMLSIQVHPNKEQALEGYKAENEKGIGLDKPSRNYKDQNHKPEMVVALGDFWLLHGFKPVNELKETLQSFPELQTFIRDFAEGDYKKLYEASFNATGAEENLKALANRILPLYDEGKLSKDNPDFWAARAIKTFCPGGPYDRGIFSIYFFNLVKLKKGEGLFQEAGLPHAYLEGQNVEIMANSDNVLRGGLTKKHIDVKELLNLIKFEPTDPAVIRPGNELVTKYQAPVSEFALTRYKFSSDGYTNLHPSSAAILLTLEGDLKINAGEAFILHPGNAVFLPAGTEMQISGHNAEAYLATVNEDKF
jgi:mannose-6-phosphate isomerase